MLPGFSEVKIYLNGLFDQFYWSSLGCLKCCQCGGSFSVIHLGDRTWRIVIVTRRINVKIKTRGNAVWGQSSTFTFCDNSQHIKRFQTPRNNKSTRSAAPYFYLFLGVWFVELLLKFTSNKGLQLFLDVLKIAGIELSFKIAVVYARASFFQKGELFKVKKVYIFCLVLLGT